MAQRSELPKEIVTQIDAALKKLEKAEKRHLDHREAHEFESKTALWYIAYKTTA